MIKVDDNFLLRPVNAYQYCDPNTFKNIETVKVFVTKGDNGKDYSYAYKPAYEAYLNVSSMLADVNIPTKLMSCARDDKDQQYTIDESFNDNLAKTHDAEEAKKLTFESAAKIGYSEHHTGLAFDVAAPTAHATLDPDFVKKYGDSAGFEFKRYAFESNGFILTYPADDRLEEVTGMKKNESWHWRYVGKEHSMRIRAIRQNVSKILGEKHEVFLEDYWSLYNKYAFSENADLVEKYTELFITEILGKDLKNELSC